MDFFDRTGPMAVGSRLRMLSDAVSKEAVRIYALGGVALKPKWFPVFFALLRGEGKTVTDIAAEIGHTHPSVCKISREMSAAGIVAESRGGIRRPQKRFEAFRKGEGNVGRVC